MNNKVDLGKITITENQNKRLGKVKLPFLKHIEIHKGEFFAVTNRNITDLEKQDILTAIQSLDTSPSNFESDKDVYKTLAFKGMSPAEADQWVEDNVINLNDAKSAIKNILKAVMILVRRSDLEAER